MRMGATELRVPSPSPVWNALTSSSYPSGKDLSESVPKPRIRIAHDQAEARSSRRQQVDLVRAGRVACHQAHVDGVGTGVVPVGSGQRCGLRGLEKRGDGGGSPGVGGLRGRAIGRGSGHHGHALGGQRSDDQVELDFIVHQQAAGTDLAFFLHGHFGLLAHQRTLRGDLLRRTDLVDHHRGHRDVEGVDADVGAEQVLLRAQGRGAAADLVRGLQAGEVDVGGGVRALGAEGVNQAGVGEGGRGRAQRQDGECERGQTDHG